MAGTALSPPRTNDVSYSALRQNAAKASMPTPKPIITKPANRNRVVERARNVQRAGVLVQLNTGESRT